MGRRSKGEGSIRQRPDGRFEGRVRVFGQRLSFYGDSRSEVADKIRSASSEAQSGVEPTKQTLEEFLKAWLLFKKSRVQESTYLSYESPVRLYLNPHLGPIPLSKLNATQVLRMIDAMEKEKKSVHLRRFVLTVLKTALADAVNEMRVLSVHPIAGLTPPRPENVKEESESLVQAVSKEEVWSHKEGAAFLAAAKKDRLYAMYLTALTMGMRQGELLGLQWADVDFDKKELVVRNSLSEHAGKLIGLKKPKSKAGRRVLSMPDVLVAALKVWRGDRIPAGYVFPSEANTPIRKSNLLKRFKRIMRGVQGLRPVRFHYLRHTAATWWIAAGCSADEVRRRLGHSQLALTMDRYCHFWAPGDKKISAAMDRLLGDELAH